MKLFLKNLIQFVRSTGFKNCHFPSTVDLKQNNKANVNLYRIILSEINASIDLDR